MRSTNREAALAVAAVLSALRFAPPAGLPVSVLSGQTGLTNHHVNKILQRNPERFERVGKRGCSPLWRRR